MKILVTGCAGFIGSHLCERLIAEGYSVIGVDNFDPFYAPEIKTQNMAQLQRSPNFKMYEADLCFASQLQLITEDFDLVIHLAAKAGVRPSIEAPEEYIDANIKATQNLLAFMLQRGVRKMIFASSSSVYGDNTLPPFKENALVDFPISPYAFTKKSCELMLYTYFHLYRLSSVSLRFFTVYGPRQRPDLAINKFFKAIENSKPIMVHGDGTTSRDYTFINDILNGVIKAIDFLLKKEETYEIINLGNNKPTQLLELVRCIENVVGKKAHIQFGPMQPGDVQMTCADTQKANQLLGYVAETTMLEGLKSYYQWLSESRSFESDISINKMK